MSGTSLSAAGAVTPTSSTLSARSLFGILRVTDERPLTTRLLMSHRLARIRRKSHRESRSSRINRTLWEEPPPAEPALSRDDAMRRLRFGYRRTKGLRAVRYP